MWTPLFVAARIVANPVSNVFQKQLAARSASPVFIVAATHALLTLACAPLLGWVVPLQLPAEFWSGIAVCALLAVASNVLLVFALRHGDLSVLGPVNAYKSILSMILAIFLIGEIPSRSGLAGVLLIVAGSYFIVERGGGQARGVQLRFAALIFSATEAVFLKRAILAASPFTTFVYWSIAGLPLAAAAAVPLLRGGRFRAESRIFLRNSPTYLWLALGTGVMQLTTLLSFGKLQVSYSLALFQLSIPLSVILGRHFFRETGIRRRLAGALVMMAGAALVTRG